MKELLKRPTVRRGGAAAVLAATLFGGTSAEAACPLPPLHARLSYPPEATCDAPAGGTCLEPGIGNDVTAQFRMRSERHHASSVCVWAAFSTADLLNPGDEIDLALPDGSSYGALNAGTTAQYSRAMYFPAATHPEVVRMFMDTHRADVHLFAAAGSYVLDDVAVTFSRPVTECH